MQECARGSPGRSARRALAAEVEKTLPSFPVIEPSRSMTEHLKTMASRGNDPASYHVDQLSYWSARSLPGSSPSALITLRSTA